MKKEDKITETPCAKLRNQLTPLYSLASMVVLIEQDERMRELAIETAKKALEGTDTINQLLKEIELSPVQEQSKQDWNTVLDRYKFWVSNDMDEHKFMQEKYYPFIKWLNDEKQPLPQEQKDKVTGVSDEEIKKALFNFYDDYSRHPHEDEICARHLPIIKSLLSYKAGYDANFPSLGKDHSECAKCDGAGCEYCNP